VAGEKRLSGSPRRQKAPITEAFCNERLRKISIHLR
jgi:hypothetical protein